VSAGALVFLATGTGPAAAEATAASECKLGKLLCGILGAGGSTPAPTPKPSAPAPKPSAKPSSKPAASRPKPAPARPRHQAPANAPATPAEQNAPAAPMPYSQQQAPALPDVSPQDPVVFPEAGPQSARPVAATEPDTTVPPPLLVATASGLVGAVAALNLSVAGHRRRARRDDS
jgi:hypothetical protein